MTTDPSNDGPPAGPAPRGTPPENRRRRFDEGDLWADDGAATTTPRSTPPRAPRTPRNPPPPRQPRAAAPAAGQAQPQQPPAQQRLNTAPPPAPVTPTYTYEEEDDEELYEDDEPSAFGNPYLLAGLAVGAAIVLAVIVVFFFGQGGDDGGQTPGTTANATQTPSATPGGGSSGATGLLAVSIAIATVREGPDLQFLELGLLQSGQEVDVVGRNEAATWFEIIFPPGTQLSGWVPETALRLPDNVEDVVAVVEPTPVPRPEVPDPTATTAAPETATPEGAEGPDLAVVIAECTPGAEIVVNVSFTGPEAITDEPLLVIVSNDGAVQSERTYEADMDVGSSASLQTGVTATPPQMAVQVLLTQLSDSDPSNNVASCSVAGGGGGGNGNVPPTPVP